MLNTLSGRFLILTTVFVLIAELLIFVPSVARFREDYFLERLERAQIASLTLLAEDMISEELEQELLVNAGVYNVVLRRDEVRQLALSSPIPTPIHKTFDMRAPSSWMLVRDTMLRLTDTEERVIRVIGNPVQDGGLLIEITLPTEPLRMALIDYGVRILLLSAVISIVVAGLLFFAVQSLIVKPIRGVVDHMKAYARSPEDSRNLIMPNASITELREAEDAMAMMQTQITGALKQKERLAQLGGAVSKISHDLRNILTSAVLFTDRIESSNDPTVSRLAPKLVNSITRAVNLCETTLAFGRVDEPAPTLARISLAEVVDDVIESERLASGENDVSFSEDIPTGMTVRADEEQIYRVLGNLVRNARQAIVATGKAGEISITGTEDDSVWSIAVTDTGPGLPKKAQEHLFEAFQGGTTRGGSGLGLAIAAELIRGHGGRLDLERTDESGTRFVISLPKSDLTLSPKIT
ncbi:HAMP domain-containing sensor histidine kinase [Octadecabacter sp. 1_MG-2023]|uniref:sensor histidine kinase n=1 Tax=unclassified Octadecabacter TaxID=196158 RepID=UPI001C09281C|nr:MULTISPECIES: HAMP domain-containing sensor histidine kinase [unclassified Octadecabacter]MBU2991657.1 HAMP domain-containing histidine kinase [Octadecabacter sp. B2R22]MDO6736183.1 HAMP domain-containing sensor histidine kinase [Octadecabacter sp. 1_MG-2023]